MLSENLVQCLDNGRALFSDKFKVHRACTEIATRGVAINICLQFMLLEALIDLGGQAILVVDRLRHAINVTSYAVQVIE